MTDTIEQIKFDDLEAGISQQWIRENITNPSVLVNVNELVSHHLQSEENSDILEQIYNETGYYNIESQGEFVNSWEEILTADIEEQLELAEEKLDNQNDIVNSLEEKTQLHNDLTDSELDMLESALKAEYETQTRLQFNFDAIETAKDNGDIEYNEILEYWAVDNWLARQLKERGEVVIGIGCTEIWGRCCSGQAILLDSVIEDIAKELYTARQERL